MEKMLLEAIIDTTIATIMGTHMVPDINHFKDGGLFATLHIFSYTIQSQRDLRRY